MANAKKRADGRYQIVFRVNGKQYCVCGKSQKEVKQKEIKKREEIKQGIVARQNPTLNTYYDDVFNKQRPPVSSSTLRTERMHFNRVANITMRDGSIFGDTKIRNVTTEDLLHVRSMLVEKNYTTRTINDTMAHIKFIFAFAEDSELIDKNPCRRLKSLKSNDVPITENKHRRLTQDEIKSFFNEADLRHSFYANHLRVMLFTGLRVGELGALMLTDIDTKNNVIRVRRTITRNESGDYLLGDMPKTESGVRDIPCNSEVFKWIRKQRELNILLGLNPRTIFCSSTGKLLREYTINREIARICKSANIPKFTTHAMRHSFGSILNDQIGDIKIISELMGHSDVSTTLKTYIHTDERRKKEAMNSFTVCC